MARTFNASTALRAGGERLSSTVDTFLAGLGQGFNAYLVARSRSDEVERLNAMSDRQLAEIGLKREDIPRHVFRDVFHL